MPNRLANATSPYLLQHADNPVDWWEWEPAAFEEARRRNVPVLLSVGYAACHWCHVMAHESFEDEATAAYLNEHYVSIKVDREERPDVDAVYMDATTAMTGHGGWPMTCVLDHDGNPWFAGTYFPDRPRHGSRRSRQVLQALSEAWRDKPDDVRRVAGNLREHLNQQPPSAAGALTERRRWTARSGCCAGLRRASAAGSAARRSSRRRWCWSSCRRRLVRQARTMLDATCDAMARGGIYDQLGGGFARYWVDAGWVVPHFEKMLYDNALLLGLYAEWAARWASGWRARPPTSCSRELRTAEGGFASALDADSEGVEGKYYAWTPSELVEVLGQDDGGWAAGVLRGDRGRHLRARQLHPAAARGTPRTPDLERLRDVRRRLLSARDQRVRPARDDKVVAAWNGLAISGLCDAGMLLGSRRTSTPRSPPASCWWTSTWLDGRLLPGVAGRRRWSARRACWRTTAAWRPASSSLVQATGDAVWLDRAPQGPRQRAGALRRRGRRLLRHRGRRRGAGRPAARPGRQRLAVRAVVDGARAGRRAHALTGEGRYRDAAEAALATVSALAERAPRFAGWSLAAAETMLRRPARGRGGRPGRCRPGRAGAHRPAAPGRGRRGRGRPARRHPAAGRPGRRSTAARGVRLPRVRLRAAGDRRRGRWTRRSAGE